MRASTCGEHNGIQVGQCGGKQFQRAADAVQEEFDVDPRARLVAADKSVQSAGKPGHAEPF